MSDGVALVRWWRGLRIALGLESPARRRERERGEIAERMDAIFAIPPTRIDTYLAPRKASAESPSEPRDGPSGDEAG